MSLENFIKFAILIFPLCISQYSQASCEINDLTLPSSTFVDDNAEPEIETSPGVVFVAIVKHGKNKNLSKSKDGPAIKSFYCAQHIDCDRYQHYTKYKLKNAPSINFNSHFSSQLGNWYVKGIEGKSYLIATTSNYPKHIAVEVSDEFYETVRSATGFLVRKWKKSEIIDASCKGIIEKYGSIKEGTAGHVLMNDIDSDTGYSYSLTVNRYLDAVEVANLKYEKKKEKLESQIDELKDKMEENIKQQLKNIESAEELKLLADDALEMAKVFKKQAKDLKSKTWYQENQFTILGTAVSTIIGTVVGFLIGEPGETVLLSTEAGEAIFGGALFGATFLGASSALDTWFLKQNFYFL